MHGFAGVAVLRLDRLLLVAEPDFFTGESAWTMPSGLIEAGEEPAAAVRELAEESGCVIDAARVTLFATAEVRHRGETLSMSWNFTATTTEARLGPAVADELVTDARWFNRVDATRLIASENYAPKREPLLRFLATGELGLHWTFDLMDSAAAIPSFEYQPPA